MKNFIAIIFLMLSPFSVVLAQHLIPVDQSSNIQFKVVNHLIFRSTVTGTFKGLKGTITFDPKNLAASSFDVSVEVKTISTGIGKRNSDLQNDKYFNEQKHPRIIIKSQSITKGSGNDEYVLTASLTMKGVTKTISFPFTAIPQKGGYQFKGHFQLNRMDYNVGPDNSIENKVVVDLLVIAK